MLLALDYDGTYTLDPELWDEFIINAQKRGHKVICATMRYASEPVNLQIDVIYTNRQPKLPFLHSIGVKPNIWIDDNPYFLVNTHG